MRKILIQSEIVFFEYSENHFQMNTNQNIDKKIFFEATRLGYEIYIFQNQLNFYK